MPFNFIKFINKYMYLKHLANLFTRMLTSEISLFVCLFYIFLLFTGY